MTRAHWLVTLALVSSAIFAPAVANPPPHGEAPAEARSATTPAPRTPEPTASESPRVTRRAPATTPARRTEESRPTAAQALAQLQEGNRRWVGGHNTHPRTEPSRRERTAREGQQPFATILSCADSRVPVEQIFDQGVGDLFVIRVAGNVVGDQQAGTIEYGSGHLKTPLLVVMGHTHCGAVAAAASDAPVEGHVADLVSAIRPAVERARRQNPRAEGESLTSQAIRENVWQSIFDLLRTSPALRSQAREGTLMIVGAVYDITSGEVEFLGEHPWQTELVAALDARDSTPNAQATPTADAKPHD